MSGHRVGTRRRMLRQDRSRRRARPPMGRRPRALPAVSERRHNSFNRAGPGKQSPPCTPGPADRRAKTCSFTMAATRLKPQGRTAPPASPGPARRGVRHQLVAKSTPPPGDKRGGAALQMPASRLNRILEMRRLRADMACGKLMTSASPAHGREPFCHQRDRRRG
jgi:hypothetical protein